VSDEICQCGHRKSQHKAIVCGWWTCHCKQFEPLTAEPKREQKPFEEVPHAGEIMSAVAAQEVTSADVAAQEVATAVAAQEVVSTDVVAQPATADIAQDVEQLQSRLRAAQEEIERLKGLQAENSMLATRLSAENNLLRESLAEIKRLAEAKLARH
jgi:hypothetical protein